ncbi:hypothetical protein chiPu_0011988 [Chiloscyllium punctatum]|uniref:Uncharacterized protein n=1 Tax=Chiloscyllium punctatum TaxID=137246 RepID=A0A401ST20_CHIPU|nr:hypothetical protein [Chiloscyllium punctatum]
MRKVRQARGGRVHEREVGQARGGRVHERELGQARGGRVHEREVGQARGGRVHERELTLNRNCKATLFSQKTDLIDFVEIAKLERSGPNFND